jgi:hypothetical protein
MQSSRFRSAKKKKVPKFKEMKVGLNVAKHSNGDCA